MLFNSFSFIGLFLPVTLLLWLLVKRVSGVRVALVWLILASLFFYAVWDPRYLALLLTSVFVNFWLGGKILAARGKADRGRARRWLAAGVTFNLLVLGGFKYAYFFGANLAALFDVAPLFGPIALPLAISFVTFQKIAYLVDCRRGDVPRHNLLDYLFFVSFFPQLIAGPIVHHRQIISQIETRQNALLYGHAATALGVSFFAIGLFKKVVLADSIATYATPVFELARTALPGGEAAWQAMLAYTLQLYFDFSGYSDMAIGLALLFGFKLPVNFASPYQAASITEFWRRWHITLSTFLRDYLYIPLGGNRRGGFMKARNLLITMTLGGLWHGAGWTFLLWGAAHGLLLLLHDRWRDAVVRRPRLAAAWLWFPAPLGIALTFLCVGLAWVLFRAADLSTALRFYTAMLHPFSGAALPAMPWRVPGQLAESILGTHADAGWFWTVAGLFIVLVLPNSTRLLGYDATPNLACKFPLRLRIGLLSGACLWLALKWMASRPATEFLYFNF